MLALLGSAALLERVHVGEPSGHAGARRSCVCVHPPPTAPAVSPLQVGTSPCHFLTLEATITQQPGGGHAAEVLLRFGGPQHQDCSSAAAATQAAAAADGAPPPVAWPDLAGVSVLGWHLPVEGATVEVVQQAEPCGELLVVERAAAAVGAGAGGLRLDLSALGLQLSCPLGLRITWSSSSVSSVQVA